MNLLLIAPDKTNFYNRINSDWFKYLDQFCDWWGYDVHYDLTDPKELQEFKTQPRKHIKDILVLYPVKFDAILIYTFRYSLRAIDFKSLNDVDIPIFGFVLDAWSDEFKQVQEEYNFEHMFSRYYSIYKTYLKDKYCDPIYPWGIDPKSGIRDFSDKPIDVCCMGKDHKKIYPVRYKVKSKLWKKDYTISYITIPYNEYMKVLKGSKISVCTASKYKVVLMKVFESIEQGALLFYNECPEMQQLGFIKGEHYIEYKDDLSDLEDKIDYYLKYDKERKEIAMNAYEFCLKNHTTKDRVKQMGEYMNAVL